MLLHFGLTEAIYEKNIVLFLRVLYGSFLTRDIAMILCDPFAINTVSKSVIKQLQRLVSTESLPRVSFLFSVLLRLLNLKAAAFSK